MTSKKNNSPGLSHAITQYETLRRAALGEVLPSGARAGLMLFLFRGMWGWAQTIATGNQWQPTNPRPVDCKAPEEYRTVIYILAAMAIQSSH